MSEFIVTHVKPGETLSGIAARYGISVDDLQRWNRIENPDLVLVDQKIVVYNTPDAAGISVPWSAESRTSSDSPIAHDSQDIAVGGAIALGLLLLLLLLRRKRRSATPIPRAPSIRQPKKPVSRRRTPAAKRQDSTAYWPSSAPDQQPKPKVNDGERLVSSKLRQRYRDWILIDNVMLPSGRGTTQIDHILVSPNAVFLIETKDMNGWVFGGPGDKQWTQSYPAGRWSRKAGTKSKQFQFYNPLWQNEGHAKSLVRLGIVNRWRLRPVVVFVGDSEMKTADKYLPFDEHEEIARQKKTWRMRGVVCMSLAELHKYIEFSVNVSSSSELTRQQMEAIRDKIRAKEIPMTAESHAKHVDFVQSVKELNSRGKDIPPPPVTAAQVVDKESLVAFVEAVADAYRKTYETDKHGGLMAVRNAFRKKGGPWRSGNVYLWIVGSKDYTIFHGFETWREGKPTDMERVDVNGLPFPKLLIGGARREGRKFLRYHYDDPEVERDEDTGSPKFGYAVSFNARGSDQKVVLGSGIYLKNQ